MSALVMHKNMMLRTRFSASTWLVSNYGMKITACRRFECNFVGLERVIERQIRDGAITFLVKGTRFSNAESISCSPR